MRAMLVLGVAVALGASAPDGAAAQETDRVLTVCMDCHRGAGQDRVRALSHADSISCRTCHHVGLTNDPELARERRAEECASCHEDLTPTHSAIEEGGPECGACHSIHEDLPAPDDATVSARCAACHEAPHDVHAPGSDDAPECTECHTAHVQPLAGGTLGATMSAGCAGCHSDAHPTHAEIDDPLDCAECHGVRGGSAAVTGEAIGSGCGGCHVGIEPAHQSASEPVDCVECHDFTAEAPLATSAATLVERCGACHADQVSGVMEGGHGRPTDSGVDAPTCLTCHSIHGSTPEGMSRRAALEATLECVECHRRQAEMAPTETGTDVTATYESDFHGATALFLALEEGGNDPDVLLCSDCHGAHDVGVLERSHIEEVCERCHGADSRLAGAWLGHRRPGMDNAVVVWLVRLFYYFLIPFMLGGLFLTIVFHLVDQRRKGARVWKAEGLRQLVARIRGKAEPVEWITRFTRVERLEHLGSMLTFILLVVTGLPQTRPDLGVAQSTIAFFGGIASTRLIHRIVGFMFIALMVAHVARSIRAAVQKRRLPIMVPSRKDFEDILQTFRHYLLKAPLPRVGKFDFAEKFEYWGLFLGGIVMSGTGLVLVFPELFSEIVPGIIVAAARTMHGLEATFAVLVVVLWHSYGVVLRPEIFPLDTSIFTGKMDVRRLKHEHALEYERLFPEQAGSEVTEQAEARRPGAELPAPAGGD